MRIVRRPGRHQRYTRWLLGVGRYERTAQAALGSLVLIFTCSFFFFLDRYNRVLFLPLVTVLRIKARTTIGVRFLFWLETKTTVTRIYRRPSRGGGVGPDEKYIGI